MKYLFIVNLVLSSKTARFWSKNQAYLLKLFPNAELFYPDAANSFSSVQLRSFDYIIVVGDDFFFSNFVNSLYSYLSNIKRENYLAYLPDQKKTAIAQSLGFPSGIIEMSELLQKKTMVPIDLVRCHFTDKKGLPASQLVLNDAVMGVSSFQLPFLQRGGKTWMKLSSLINSDKKNKRLVLSQKDKVINDKKVFLAFILLGNSLIGGPKIHTKLRISKSKFDYYHLCPGSFKKLSSLNPFQTFLDNDLMRKEAFSDLGIDGLDEEVELIIDGVLLGRLPAAFTFLPKALKIVAPLISIPVKANWKEKISNVKVIDPVGNRKVMRSYYTEDN